MDEFNERMDSQRKILDMVNKMIIHKEGLCGLSRKSIERWISVNKFKSEDGICIILKQISAKLQFLAVNSQNHISENYKSLTSEVYHLKKDLLMAIKNS